MKFPLGGKRLTKTEREEILKLYFESPDHAVALARTYGLSEMYPYKLANSLGLLPLKIRTKSLESLNRAEAALSPQASSTASM